MREHLALKARVIDRMRRAARNIGPVPVMAGVCCAGAFVVMSALRRHMSGRGAIEVHRHPRPWPE
jgi:hypothetical protein